MKAHVYFQTCAMWPVNLSFWCALLCQLAQTSAWSSQLGCRSSRNLEQTLHLCHRKVPHHSTLSAVSLSSDERESRILINLEESIRSGMKDISANHVGAPSIQSLTHAIEQVHALFDLACAEEENMSISSDLAVSALEGLVRRVLQTVSISAEDFGRPLHAIEELMGRVDELGANPSVQTVESLWMIQQYQWQTTMSQFPENVNSTLSDALLKLHLDRTISLLQNWTRWAQSSGKLLSGRSPPVLFLLKVLQTSSRQRLGMTHNLWALVEAMVLNTTHGPHCRDVHHYLLDVLSYSGPTWDYRQCFLLQSLLRRTNDTAEVATNSTILMRALRASAQAGQVPDTAWLARRLRRNALDTTICESLEDESINMLFLESLLHSKDSGSLLYMEQLLLSRKDTGFPLNSRTLKLLLRKCADTKAPGSGLRAERVFYRAMPKVNETNWHPDDECVRYVAEAHLRGGMLSHVRLADRFVRKYVKTFGLLPSHQATAYTNNGIFENILQAYCNLAANEDDGPKTFRYADEFFRFYLIQHRDGRVATETPSPRHLQHWKNLWNAATNVTTLTSAGLADYERIIQNLKRGGIE